MKAFLWIILLCIFPCWCIAQFAGGSGTSNDPWQVATAEQLYEVDRFWNDHFIQIADIDLGGDDPEGSFYNGGNGWQPIYEFSGTYDGQGHVISGLYIEGSLTRVGLFEKTTNSAIIRHVTLKKIKIEAIFSQQIGGLAAFNTGTIENCTVSGDIIVHLSGNYPRNQGSDFGGLVGRNNGQINRSSAEVNLNVTACGVVRSGGLVGGNFGVIQECYATGDLYGHGCTEDLEGFGGLVGSNFKGGRIIDSYATGDISGIIADAGGLSGRNWDSTSPIPGVTSSIHTSYAIGQLYPSLNYQNAGGLVGRIGRIENHGSFDNRGLVEESYWLLSEPDDQQWDNGNGEPFYAKEAYEGDVFKAFDEEIWAVKRGDTLSFPYLRNNPQDPAPGLYIPLKFLEQPESDTIIVEESVLFSPKVSGDTPIAYQWYHEGVPVPEATTEEYTLDAASFSDAGEYYLKAYNPKDTITSDTITLTITDCHNDPEGEAYIDSCGVCVEGNSGHEPCTRDCADAWGGEAYEDDCSYCIDESAGEEPCIAVPQFETQLQDTTVMIGEAITLEVEVSGEGPFTYQWYHEGEPIPGEETAEYTLDAAEWQHVGAYHVVVSSPWEQASSDTAQLDVLAPDEVSVYPIPTAGELFIDLRGWSEESHQTTLFTLKGQECLKTTLHGGKVNTLELGHFPSAVYIIQITSEEKTFRKKISTL